MIDLNLKINFPYIEFDLISRTVSALLSIKLAVVRLCLRYSNLLRTNATVNFMLQSLKGQYTSLSEELAISKTIRREIDLFEDEGFRGKYLEKVYRALLTVPPNVDAERMFSTAGNICTKLRSRLYDSTFDALWFSRSHFNNL
ncbi:hypothetical protein TNCV_1379991 [Trichonephila clavipes]|nr:hypothetical protein TNCV_1379991 [Trichonephila clavipes]